MSQTISPPDGVTGAPVHRPVAFSEPDVSDDDIAAVTEVLRSGWITTGAECAQLEGELADYLGVEFAVGVSSCTAALEIALAHLRLAPGARVGVPTWTFSSSALAAVHNGAQPVLIDCDPDTLNVSAEALEASVRHDDLAAVVGVHFGGQALPVEVHDICADAGVPLVEDAAHALGARDHRGMVAGQGTTGACFSFYATKNLTSAEGGALTTDDEALADFARSHRLHGMSRDAWARYLPDGPTAYDVVSPGIKANLPDVLAALARSQLRRFEESQSLRRALVHRYREHLASIEGIELVPGQHDDRSADHLMVVLLPEGTDRPAVVSHLRDLGVGTSVHFQPLHTLSWFREHAAIGRAGVAHADEHRLRALSLPLHTRLALDDVDHVCVALDAALSRAAR